MLPLPTRGKVGDNLEIMSLAGKLIHLQERTAWQAKSAIRFFMTACYPVYLRTSALQPATFPKFTLCFAFSSSY